MKRCLLLAGLLVLVPAGAGAWPATIVQSLMRDARRLVPASLARLIAEREPQILEEAEHLSPAVGHALAVDLGNGRLEPETLAALGAQADDAVDVLRKQQVSLGIVRLGGTLRIPADLSDPVLAVGSRGYPPGVVREYYAFLDQNLGKIPVVLDDPPALKMQSTRDLPPYWQALLERSRAQSEIIRQELFQEGRLVDHRSLDYRSPVFAVASLSYSRAVTAIAATWLAVWREARGDLTRTRTPRVIEPRDRGPEAPHPQALHPMEARNHD